MNYIELNVDIEPASEENKEIVVALLGELEFESFEYTELGIRAFVKEEGFSPEELQVLRSIPEVGVRWEHRIIEQQNWNKIWESNFTPILVNNECYVRAPFHKQNTDVTYEIVIEPKMSFGTGHHSTTFLMIEQILENEISGKNVLDMGSGTGILAILAKKRGAGFTEAIDIDEWAYENCIENIHRNNCSDIKVFHGDSNLLVNKRFDIIFANINRNILLKDMGSYANCLKDEAIIFFSGIYKEDIPTLEKEANKHKIFFLSYKEKNNWVSVKAIKQ